MYCLNIKLATNKQLHRLKRNAAKHLPLKKRINMYSAEWSQVVKNYEAYKESLSVFRKYISKTKDLSKALHSSNINCYYALEVLRYMPNETCISLLEDLFYVLIYSNDTYSFYAKSIILRLIDDKLVETIADLANKYSQNTTDSEDIKNIAQLLFECKNKNRLYEETYVLFSKKHLSVLITEDFFDDEEYKYL